MAKRVLYDTNVLVRILARRGELLMFREMVIKMQVIHVTSEYILAEVETVLSSKLGLTKQKAKVVTRALARVSEVVKPTDIVRVSRDPNDDEVLAAAVEGKADYLVTADVDLLVIGDYQGVKIVNFDFHQISREFTKIEDFLEDLKN